MTCSRRLFLVLLASLATAVPIGAHPLRAVHAADAPGLPRTVAPDAKLVEVYAADAFFEGPVWHKGTGKLYFTLHKGKTNQILRLDEPGKVTVWMDPSEGVGGLYPAPGGRLYATQAYGHRLLDFAVGKDGPEDVKVLHRDPTWNQPNDLCTTPDGKVWFTDPDFGKRKSSAIWMWDGKAVRKAADDMPLPNGIIASLDGRTLFVSDSHEKNWRAYPIREDGTLGPGRTFFDPGNDKTSSPDGMSIDEEGNLYFTGRGGVWVVTPDGKPLGLVETPNFVSNCTIGSDDGKTLYLVGSGKVHSLRLQVRGATFRAP